jgi:lysozyme
MTVATDLPPQARAFLDALAIGESGGASDDAAYSVLFGGSHFPIPPWPTTFPQWDGVSLHGVRTHAAGRYQFEPATWRGLQAQLHLPDFSPASQDRAAWALACQVRHGLLAELVAGELDGIATALHSTWTSLSEETFAERYTAALATYPTS